jgi:hypothetical protein
MAYKNFKHTPAGMQQCLAPMPAAGNACEDVLQLHEAALHEDTKAHACRHAAALGNSLGCEG